MTASTPAPVKDELIRSPRAYQSRLFVDRKRELETIARNVRELQAQQTVTNPIVNFWGVRGSGKTWLLQHLNERYAYTGTAAFGERSTFTLFYSFTNELASSSSAAITSTLANEVWKQLGASLTSDEYEQLIRAHDARDMDALVRVLLDLSQRLTALILLDNAENIPQGDWEYLEQVFIEPLVSKGQALIVVAGRRQVSQWRRFEVRRRVMEPDKSRVPSFDKETVIKQLERQSYRIPVDLLFPYTAGNPLLVDAIAQHIADWTKDTQGIELTQSWFDQHQMGLLQILRATEAQLLEHIPTALLRILYAVSPLRFYRLKALQFMLTRQHIVADQPEGYYLNILRALNEQTEVVWWDRGHRAYVTSQTVRQLVNRRQLLEDRAIYAERHRQALSMYWKWVEQFPETSEDFIFEIWFHLASIYHANGDALFLREQAQRALRAARDRLKDDRFMILLEELERDQELLDLLPADLHDELRETLGHLLGNKSS